MRSSHYYTCLANSGIKFSAFEISRQLQEKIAKTFFLFYCVMDQLVHGQEAKESALEKMNLENEFDSQSKQIELLKRVHEGVSR